MGGGYTEQLGQKLTASDYDALLSSLNQTALVSVTNAEGDIIFANQKFVEVSKYGLGELIGQNHRILKSGDQPDELFDELWSTISSGQVWRGEIKNRAKDGSFYWVDTSIAPIVGSNGKPERYISVRVVITDKKRREAMLEESKAKDEAILASIGDGLIATDPAGLITLINPKAQELLGWRADEVLGKPVDSILPIQNDQGDELPPKDRPRQKALQQRRPFSPTVTHYYVCKDKHKFPVAITVAPIMLNNDLIGAIDVFRDITREKEIEQAKDEFISIASHQLRTPATAVKQYVGMLLDGFADELTSSQRLLLRDAYDSNERQIQVVNDLLRVARVDAGQIKLSREPTDIVALVKNIINDQAEQIKIHEQILSFDYMPRKIVLSIDADHMRMVLENILENAIKYTPPGKQIDITINKNSRYVSIVVADEGIGMDPQDIPKIFEKFSRLDSLLSTSVGGTGLGLYWAEKIVRLHGGRISVQSRPGRGSHFSVRLPLTKFPGSAKRQLRVTKMGKTA